MSSADYPYTKGDLLTHPQTYQYSTYLGPAFLEAWRENRNMALSRLGAPQAPPSAMPGQHAENTLGYHLETLLAEITSNTVQEIPRRLQAWIKKFEVRKQLFAAYDAELKPIGQELAPLNLYLRYAEIMTAARQSGAGLPCLNVLLKILDTLIARSDLLTPEESSRLAGLVLSERAFIEKLDSPSDVLPPDTIQLSRKNSSAPHQALHLDNIVFLAADTPRSKAYAQALAQRNISVKAGILFCPANGGQAGQKANPPKGEWPGAPILLPNFEQPLARNLTRICKSVQSITADHVNDPVILQTLLAYAPDVVIYSGYGSQIVGQALLTSGIEFLHIHAGWLPEFRGSTTTYYHLLQTGRCGASAILLRSRLDEGPILAKKWYPRPPAGLDIDYIYDSATRADLLAGVLQRLAKSGTLPTPEIQIGKSEMYYIIHPVLKHLATLRVENTNSQS